MILRITYEKERLTRILNHEIVKLIAVISSILLIDIGCYYLFDDIDLDNRILVYNTFATLAIAGFFLVIH